MRNRNKPYCASPPAEPIEVNLALQMAQPSDQQLAANAQIAEYSDRACAYQNLFGQFAQPYSARRN